MMAKRSERGVAPYEREELFPLFFRVKRLRDPFGDLAHASNFFGREDLLPIIEVGTAIELDRVCLVLCQFSGVLGTAGILDDVLHAFGEIQPERFL